MCSSTRATSAFELMTSPIEASPCALVGRTLRCKVPFMQGRTTVTRGARGKVGELAELLRELYLSAFVSLHRYIGTSVWKWSTLLLFFGVPLYVDGRIGSQFPRVARRKRVDGPVSARLTARRLDAANADRGRSESAVSAHVMRSRGRRTP